MKEGICTDSRWKEDASVVDVKGYRFRDIPRQSSISTATAAVSLKAGHSSIPKNLLKSKNQNLKSAEELEVAES